jgi:hypothetical protein
MKPVLMHDMEFRTYAALFDLCVQQGGIYPVDKHGIPIKSYIAVIRMEIYVKDPQSQ